MSLLLLYRNPAVGIPRTGSLSPGAYLTAANAVTYVCKGTLAAGASLSGSRFATAPRTQVLPTVTYQLAFDSPPLTVNPAFEDLSDRLRDEGGLKTQRGRSYEFSRTETGTARATLSNRDAALSPENTTSPYAPLKSTRPIQAHLTYETAYPLFYGITEGYPQAFPHLGYDAIVELQAADLFYALNQTKFTPGSTTLAEDLTVITDDADENITVASTDYPLPVVTPFNITIDEGGTAQETLTVTAIVDSTTWTVARVASASKVHTIGAAVTTTAVSFPSELSGERIQRVLEAVGFDAPWYDLDAGQTLMTATEDLASVNPLEHINLISEAEFGRFFVSRDGKFTFRDRHSIILDFLVSSMTFSNESGGGGSGYGGSGYGSGGYGGSGPDGIPFQIEGALEHSEDKLFNRVRIIIPSGVVVDIKDDASIADHFERVFERQWPYANANDAEAAAYFILGRSVEHSLRLPRISVRPAARPENWPTVLDREIGDRATFYYQPSGGGDPIDQEVIIEGIAHDISADQHVVSFQMTEADPNEYWILGLAGYSELGETTFVGF